MAVIKANLAVQERAAKLPRDTGGVRTKVPTHGGGRRAVQWRRGKVLGSHGGFRGVKVAKSRKQWKVKRTCRICGLTHKYVANHELQCVAKWHCLLRDRQSLCLVGGAPAGVLSALQTCISCGQRVRASAAGAALSR